MAVFSLDVANVLTYPDAVALDSERVSMLEKLPANQQPRKLFQVLMKHGEPKPDSPPAVRDALTNFKQRYYDFRRTATTVEAECMKFIANVVSVRFAAGWAIYFRYSILRLSGNSPDALASGHNFLNYEITWADAERVHLLLDARTDLKQAVLDVFREFGGLIDDVERVLALASSKL